MLIETKRLKYFAGLKRILTRLNIIQNMVSLHDSVVVSQGAAINLFVDIFCWTEIQHYLNLILFQKRTSLNIFEKRVLLYNSE